MSETLKQLAQQKHAVALYYDGDQAPTVAATGVGSLAKELLEVAREHRIPIYENPELVELLTHLDLGDEIPEALYQIVAEIIAFVFHLQGYSLDDIKARSNKTN